MARTYTSKPRMAGGRPTFVLDDVEFRCAGAPSLMDLSELARLSELGVDSVTPEGMSIIAEFLSGAMGRQEYNRFRTHIREHGTDPEMVMEILQGIVEDFVARPTSRPSVSPDGPPATPTSSTVVSFSRGTVETGPLEAALRPVETVQEQPKVFTYG
ncbi:hypothetical protein AB0J28_00675 [Streptosporangium canum]|uniref:hypothetical protein n=1 Tax=Streptosporangium canum TaxID=324952 RepID=UPI0034400D7F